MYGSQSFLKFAAILTLLLAPPMMAQNAGSELVRHFPGEEEHSAMGTSIASAYVNDDEYLDLIVGAHLADPNNIEDAGIVYVYCGETFDEIWCYEGTHEKEWVGSSVARIGDTDGDGLEEFVVGAYGYNVKGNAGGAAYVFSYADDQPKYTLLGENGGDFFGACVSGTGDVDGDGAPDFIVGAHLTDPGGKTDAGTVYVFSGKDPVNKPLIARIDGEDSGDHFGFSVAGAGDVNGDGDPDMIVGACYADDELPPDPKIDTGAAYVYEIKTKDLIWKKYGKFEHDHYGWSVSGAGKVNNNTLDDVIIGIRGEDPNGQDYAGAAEVYGIGIGGGDWKMLHRFEGRAARNYMGTSVAGAGDLDGDGHDDLIVGAESVGGLGAVYLFRGKKGPAKNGGNGLLICRIDGESPGGYFGNSVAGVGDVDCDGCLEVAVGAYWANKRAGCAYLYRCQPTLHVFKAGFDDNFTKDFPGPGRSEFSSVEFSFEKYLRKLPGGNPVYEFDVPCINKFFGHTFQQFYDTFDFCRGLPTCIVRAELEFRVRPGPAHACFNDTIVLGYDRVNPPGRFWSHKFADLSQTGQWKPNQPAELFTLDLGALPDGSSEGKSILAQIEAEGFLDVMIQDDTEVDFMTLRIWTSQPQNLIMTQEQPHSGNTSPVFKVDHPDENEFDKVLLVVSPAWKVRNFTWASCFPFYFEPRASFFRDHYYETNVLSPFTFDSTYTLRFPYSDVGRYITAQAVIADWSVGPTYWYLSNTITAPVF